MKKVFLLAMLAFIGFLSANAHRKPEKGSKSVERRIEKLVDRLEDRLDLTDTQEEKIKALYTDFYKDGNQNKDRAARKSGLEQLDQKIKDLLTDDQKAKFDKMKLNKRMSKGKSK